LFYKTYILFKVAKQQIYNKLLRKNRVFFLKNFFCSVISTTKHWSPINSICLSTWNPENKNRICFLFRLHPQEILFVGVFFAHSVHYTYILPKNNRAVHKYIKGSLIWNELFAFTFVFKKCNVHAVDLVHTWSTTCLAMKKVFLLSLSLTQWWF
jgi:hypothetical protein